MILNTISFVLPILNTFIIWVLVDKTNVPNTGVGRPGRVAQINQNSSLCNDVIICFDGIVHLNIQRKGDIHIYQSHWLCQGPFYKHRS